MWVSWYTPFTIYLYGRGELPLLVSIPALYPILSIYYRLLSALDGTTTCSCSLAGASASQHGKWLPNGATARSHLPGVSDICTTGARKPISPRLSPRPPLPAAATAASPLLPLLANGGVGVCGGTVAERELVSQPLAAALDTDM